MEITPIGYIILPLGVILLFVRPGWLFVLTVFFAPFTATSVLNQGSGEGASGIQPYLYFGSLFMLRQLIELIFNLRFKIRAGIRSLLLVYLIFNLVCVVSLVMPIIIDGRFEVLSNGTLQATLEPLRLSSKNIVAIVSLIYGFCFTLVVATKSTAEEQFSRTVNIYMISALFVSCWGFLQFGLGVLGIPYPVSIFNNNASPYAILGGAMSSLNAVRISSVAMEPSTFAVILVGMLGLQVAALLQHRNIFGKRADWITAVILFVALLLTGSASGYVGLAAILILAFPVFLKGRKAVRRLVVAAGVLVIFVAIISAVPQTRLFLQENIFSKSDSYSALERGAIIYADFQYFLQYPVLGIGWGSAPTHDLTMGLLANSGLLGLGAFCGFFAFLIRRLRRRNASVRNSGQAGPKGSILLLPLIATIIAYAVSGLPVGGTFSLLIGLAIVEAKREDSGVLVRERKRKFFFKPRDRALSLPAVS